MYSGHPIHITLFDFSYGDTVHIRVHEMDFEYKGVLYLHNDSTAYFVTSVTEYKTHRSFFYEFHINIVHVSMTYYVQTTRMVLTEKYRLRHHYDKLDLTAINHLIVHEAKRERIRQQVPQYLQSFKQDIFNGKYF